MIFQTYFISTGAKNAMYTLRVMRTCASETYSYFHEHYICTLAADLEKAQYKATLYFDSIKDRISGPDITLYLDINPDNENYKRRGKLSVKETQFIEDIEDGIFPYGKNKGTKIADAPMSYVLFFADKMKENEQNVVFSALSAACMGVAVEKGYIAKRQQVRDEIRERELLSNFIGDVGKRQVFTGEIVSVFTKPESDYEAGYTFTKVAIGNDLVCFYNNEMGKKGDIITFKATIKKHDVYKDIKTTRVNRPKKMENAA